MEEIKLTAGTLVSPDFFESNIPGIIEFYNNSENVGSLNLGTKIGDAVESIGQSTKSAVIGIFDTIGQSAGALTQPLINQVLLIMGVAIVGIYFLSKSKIKFGV